MSLFDFDRDIHAAINSEWDLSPAAFVAAVVTDTVAPDMVAHMASQLCIRNVPARVRLNVLCDVVRAAAKVMSFMPASKVAFDNGLNERIVASEDDPDGLHTLWDAPPVPEWRTEAAAAHRRMETAAAAAVDGDAVRAACARDLAEQKATEDEAIEEHRRRTAAKAHLVMQRVTGHHAHLLCVCVGLLVSIRQVAWQKYDVAGWIRLTAPECERWRSAKHRFWIDGMRMLYGPLLAAWPRADLAQLRVAALMPFGRHLSHRVSAWVDANLVWPDEQTRLVDLAHDYVRPLTHLWDEELQRSSDASNAAAILSRGVRTADGHALYADAVHSIAAMLDPHTRA